MVYIRNFHVDLPLIACGVHDVGFRNGQIQELASSFHKGRMKFWSPELSESYFYPSHARSRCYGAVKYRMMQRTEQFESSFRGNAAR